MIFLVRRLTGSWRSATRARLLYVVVAVAFCGLAVAGAVSGNAEVAVLAAVAAILTLGIAIIASRLSARTGATPPTKVGGIGRETQR